jgi:hypothetical protein
MGCGLMVLGRLTKLDCFYALLGRKKTSFCITPLQQYIGIKQLLLHGFGLHVYPRRCNDGIIICSVTSI